MLWRDFGYYEIIFVLNTLEFPVIINGQYTSKYLQNWIHFYFVMYRVDHLLFVRQTEATHAASGALPAATTHEQQSMTVALGGVNLYRAIVARIIFRKCNKKSLELQQVLKTSPSWQNGLSVPTKHDVNPWGSFSEIADISLRMSFLSSSRVSGFVLYTLPFKLPHKLKSQGVKSGNVGPQTSAKLRGHRKPSTMLPDLQEQYDFKCIMKGFDDGVMHFEEYCFWTLYIVQCFFPFKKQRFGSWFCFLLQVKKWGRGGTYSVGSLKKS
jgi:hypothetical protein